MFVKLLFKLQNVVLLGVGSYPAFQKHFYFTRSISFYFIFHFWRVSLQQNWFSRGPPLERKKYIYKVKYNPIINKGKRVARNLKRKMNGAMRSWLLASLEKLERYELFYSH